MKIQSKPRNILFGLAITLLWFSISASSQAAEDSVTKTQKLAGLSKTVVMYGRDLSSKNWEKVLRLMGVPVGDLKFTKRVGIWQTETDLYTVSASIRKDGHVDVIMVFHQEKKPYYYFLTSNDGVLRNAFIFEKGKKPKQISGKEVESMFAKQIAYWLDWEIQKNLDPSGLGKK